MNEAGMYPVLIQELKKQCHTHNLKCHVVRIESNLTAQGIPDIYCCVRGRQFWIECKWRVSIVTPMQWSFIEQERMAAGKVFLVRCYGNWYVDDMSGNGMTIENAVGSILARIL